MGNQETGRKIMIDLLNNPAGDQYAYVMELQRLLMCYQVASPDDKIGRASCRERVSSPV